MGRVTVFENPADLSDFQEFEHTGPLIDFLTERFPFGFGGRSHVTAINGNKVQVEDYDSEIAAKDVVAVIVLPADPVSWLVAAGLSVAFSTAIVGAVTGVLVSTVLNYAINAFFGPKGSKPTSPNSAGIAVGGGLPAASPTYSLGVPSNTARLGQPIPVAYGNNLMVPDLAAEPYAWFENNDQYVGLLLCLGQGTFDIQQILVGNTDTASLASGVLTKTVIPGWSHVQTFGLIQNATGIYENVYTSPEVSDQLISAAVEAEGAGGTYSSSGNLFNEQGHAMFYLDNDASSWAAQLYSGKQVWAIVTNSGGPMPSGNDGNYLVTYIANPGQKFAGHKGHVSLSSWPFGYTNATVQLSLTNPDYWDPAIPAGGPSGPFAATTPGVQTGYLQYDLVFPSGAYTSDLTTGAIASIYVSVQFIAEQIDDNGVVIGSPLTTTFSETLATTTPQRRTIHHAVPYGRYQVTAMRITPKSWHASSQSDVNWVGLKAILGNTEGGPVYGDTTIIAIKAKATEGLARDALNRISVRCTRYHPRYGTLSRNPADAFSDILTNTVYGGKRPDAEIDWPTLTEKQTAWGTANKYFDAVYDTQTNLWDALRMSLQMVHTAPTMSGSLVTLVEDKNYLVPEFSLTTDTIKALSLTFLFPDGEEVDGVEAEYRDPDDNAQLFVTYPSTALNPEKIVLFGCRDYYAALAYATQRWKQLSLRRLLVTAETELEAEVIRVGAPVNITHPKLNGGAATLCIVHSVKSTGEFDKTIEFHRHEPGVYA